MPTITVSEKMALNTCEVAALMGISRPTLYQLLNSNDPPPHFCIGTRRVFPADALREWLNRRAGVTE